MVNALHQKSTDARRVDARLTIGGRKIVKRASVIQILPQILKSTNLASVRTKPPA